jgi:benzoate-CoA ligase family protein
VTGRLPAPFNASTFFLDRHLQEGRGQRVYLRHRGRAITYADAADGAARFAGALRDLGVEVGDRVLLALDDGPAFAAAFWGTLRRGAVAVPVNTLMTAAEYRFVLDDSGATVAVVEPAVAARLLEGRACGPGPRALAVAGAAAPDGALALDGLLAAAPAEAAATRAGDIAYWGYTSGSTGRPKAAVHPHRDFVAAADRVGVEVLGLRPDDLVFSTSKTYFAYGLGNSIYFPARVGAAALLVSERLEPRQVLDVVAAERPTVLFGVATLFARLLQAAEDGPRPDLSSLRLCVTSGEALPPAVFDAWQRRFGLELLDVLGSTEALHDFIANRPGRARRGSAGQVVPGFEARLVDDQGQPVPPGTVGHLLVKGETTAPYYWNRPERTRATMLGEWLRTGDMLWQDADGYFYFAGRSDDMLKVAGQWVSPAEVEGRLVEHGAVIEAGVVGRPDGAGLVRPHAFVVLADGATPSPELASRLQAFVRERLAGFKVPRTVEFVPELPRTATGKVQRFRLRQA